jgi:predicted RecB family nuclease
MVTSQLFEDYLACSTKCFLRYTGAVETENTFVTWLAQWHESYRRDAINKLSVDWELVLDQVVQAENFEATIPAIQTVRADKKRGATVVPLHFVPSNKISRTNRLVAAFNAFALSKSSRIHIDFAKIIYGEKRSAFSIRASALFRDVGKVLEKVTELLSNTSPPELVLNSHCPECEYRDRCRRKATEKNDLSLLANLSARERRRLNKKGIFTVHQLSYTFRPRRRAKRLALTPEKYHHSLKALAFREGKTHVVGDVQLRIDGTSVVFDVEGIPDREFFYLIGIRFEGAQGAVRHHLWADVAGDEGRLWKAFLNILSEIDNPVLLHYGSYEKTFLEKMGHRYGGPDENSRVGRAIRNSINVLSVIYATCLFPDLFERTKGDRRISRV